MSGQLRVEFMGLTGFVPIKTGGQQDDALLAVLPDLMYGADVEPADGVKKRIPPHVPALIVPTDTVIHHSNKTPAMTFETGGGPFAGRSYSLFPFSRECMNITGLDGNGLNFSKDPVIADQVDTHSPQNSQAVQGLQWVPDISLANRQANRDVGTFNSERFLNQDHTPAKIRGSAGLAATILVDGGNLYVDEVRREKGEPVVFEFRVPGEATTEWLQAVYSRLLWDGSFSGERLTLDFHHGDDPLKRGALALRPIDGWCEMWVANLELEALLGIGKQEYRGDMDADIDSSIFYSFCKNVPTPKQGMPVAHVPGGSAAGGSGLCIPMMFKS